MTRAMPWLLWVVLVAALVSECALLSCGRVRARPAPTDDAAVTRQLAARITGLEVGVMLARDRHSQRMDAIEREATEARAETGRLVYAVWCALTAHADKTAVSVPVVGLWRGLAERTCEICGHGRRCNLTQAGADWRAR
jgi:hypothetical protein